MKFSDKLQKLRKENNITQEGLADKLNVSRQAVSKWESGTGYPDTEKLIQLSKIFNVTMDELVNEEEIKKDTKEDKIGIRDIINKIIDFIMKSINMFGAMKFGDKIKCLGEMAVSALLIYIVAAATEIIGSEIVRRIFMFLPGRWLMIVGNIIEAIFYIGWLVLGMIIIIKIFKMRYLDYYVVINDKKIEQVEIEKPIPELKQDKNVKVVIRDPKDSSNSIFKYIGNMLIIVFKGICLFIGIPVVIFFILLVGMLIISLFYIRYGLLFTGINIALLGGILFSFIIIWFIYNIINDQKQNFKKIFIVFILSISLMGIGGGLAFSDIDSFDIDKGVEYTDSEIEIEMNDNLLWHQLNEVSEDKIVIDNDMDNILVEVRNSQGMNAMVSSYMIWNNDNKYEVVNIYNTVDSMDYYRMVIDKLKEKKIVLWNNTYEIEKVYISGDNLTKIRNNYRNYYD